MVSHRFRKQSILALVLLLSSGLILAQAEKEKPEQQPAEKARKAEAAEEVKVYTNEDLRRLFAGEEPSEEPAGAEPGDPKQAAPAEAAKKPAEAEDPLARMNRERADQVDRQKKIQVAEAKVAELRERVVKYESGLLSVRNTLLSRRVAPKKPDEDSEAAEGWDELDNAERVERSEKELEKARKELKQAEAELARLRSG